MEELKHKDKLTAFKDELCCMLRNIFRRGEVCLQAGGLLQYCFMKKFNLICSLKVNFKFLADAGFVCEKPHVTAAVLVGGGHV